MKEADLEKEFGRYGTIERVCVRPSSKTLTALTQTQIRIVKDTHQEAETEIKSEDGEAMKKTSAKKKKKPHRGYAFIVYEREKDMKGN